MNLAGRVFKSGNWWVIEVPLLGVTTQARTKHDAFEMIADAVELLVNQSGFRIEVFPGRGEYFEISANDLASLFSLLLRRLRLKSGLTLAQMAARLGARSHNAYARYEQGASVPTVEMFDRLLAAVSPGTRYVLRETGAADRD